MAANWIAQAVKLLHQEDGQSLAEYGLVASIIAIGAIGILSAIGTNFNTFFSDVAQIIVDTVNAIL